MWREKQIVVENKNSLKKDKLSSYKKHIIWRATWFRQSLYISLANISIADGYKEQTKHRTGHRVVNRVGKEASAGCKLYYAIKIIS